MLILLVLLFAWWYLVNLFIIYARFLIICLLCVKNSLITCWWHRSLIIQFFQIFQESCNLHCNSHNQLLWIMNCKDQWNNSETDKTVEIDCKKIIKVLYFNSEYQNELGFNVYCEATSLYGVLHVRRLACIPVCKYALFVFKNNSWHKDSKIRDQFREIILIRLKYFW